MTGTTTGQTSFATATDSDDVEAYSTGALVAVLQALANLFDSATGHDHTGPGKGKPIGGGGLAVLLQQSAALGAGVTLTAAVWSTGVSVTLGAGTWIIWGGITLSNGSAGVVGMEGRITDGVAVRSSAGGSVPASSSTSFGLPPAVVTPTGSSTYNLQGLSTGASGSILATTPSQGQAKATAIAALQIA